MSLSLRQLSRKELHQRRLQRQNLADEPGVQLGRSHDRARSAQIGAFTIGFRLLCHPCPERFLPVRRESLRLHSGRRSRRADWEWRRENIFARGAI